MDIYVVCARAPPKAKTSRHCGTRHASQLSKVRYYRNLAAFDIYTAGGEFSNCEREREKFLSLKDLFSTELRCAVCTMVSKGVVGQCDTDRI